MTKETRDFSAMEQNLNGRNLNGVAGSVDRIDRIRDLNAHLRKTGRGGVYLITSGLAALGVDAVEKVLRAVAAYDAFNLDNDPTGEHDCAVLNVEDHTILWKIDYYDRTRTYHSPDAANPKLTVRVLTVMLASEY